MTGLIGCNSTNHVDFNEINSKNLVKIVDITGRVTEEKKTLCFFIYMRMEQ